MLAPRARTCEAAATTYALPSAHPAGRRAARRCRRPSEIEDDVALTQLGERRRVASTRGTRATASAGSPAVSGAITGCLVIGSAPPRAGVDPQHELPPLLTADAAAPYFALTTSLISVGVRSGALRGREPAS